MFPESAKQLIRFTSVASQRTEISPASSKHSLGVEPHYGKGNSLVKLCVRHTVPSGGGKLKKPAVTGRARMRERIRQD